MQAPTRVSVLELPWLERTLLWLIRTWAAYHDAPQTVWWHLERVFTEAGIRPALEPFAQLMASLFAGLKRSPDIRCVRCLRLGKGELLATLAADAQQQNLALRFANLLSPTAARSAAAAVAEMMHIIKSAGLRLQPASSAASNTPWPPEHQMLSTSHH